MGKAAQVLKLVRKINVGRMFDTAREISQQTGKKPAGRAHRHCVVRHEVFRRLYGL